jgi:hypothetical protein
MDRLQLDPEDALTLQHYQKYIVGAGYCILQPPDKGKRIYIHRWIMQPPHNMQVDHINGDKLDNRRANLRICSRSQNQWNRRSSNVGWSKKANKWRVEVWKHNRNHWGGYWKDKQCAEAMAFMMKLDLHGEFANFEK